MRPHVMLYIISYIYRRVTVVVSTPGGSADLLRASFEQEPALEDRPYCGVVVQDTSRYLVTLRPTKLEELTISMPPHNSSFA
jgi:hypothetical protein